MEDRIDVSKIKTTRDTFTNKVRGFIKRFYDQEFTAIQLITVIMSDPMHSEKHPDTVKRTVRTVIREMVDKGFLREVQVGVSASQPGIYVNIGEV